MPVEAYVAAGEGVIFKDEMQKLNHAADLFREEAPFCAEALERAAREVGTAYKHWCRALDKAKK